MCRVVRPSTLFARRVSVLAFQSLTTIVARLMASEDLNLVGDVLPATFAAVAKLQEAVPLPTSSGFAAQAAIALSKTSFSPLDALDLIRKTAEQG
jgi:hypothetical protein